MKNKKNKSTDDNPLAEEVKVGLIPAIIQDYKTNEVLMMAYMDKESLRRSIKSGTTWFWSRSRKKYWHKGETSGNSQIIKEIKYDCDNDTLLVKVKQIGNACHTGAWSCFFNDIDISVDIDEKILDKLNYQENQLQKSSIFESLYSVIEKRLRQKPKDSYTYSLHKKGLNEILKKIGEEVIEVIISAKNETRDRTIYEISDLLYHLLVLMVEKKITIDDIEAELKLRRRGSGKQDQ